MGAKRTARSPRARGAWGRLLPSRVPSPISESRGGGTGRLERPSHGHVAARPLWPVTAGGRGARDWGPPEERLPGSRGASSLRRYPAEGGGGWAGPGWTGLGWARRAGGCPRRRTALARPALRCRFANAVAAATPTAGSRGSLAQEVAEPTLAPSSGLSIEFMLKKLNE